ncbi:hypothetical protein BKA70DRAFT_1476056 [Coprinopsis sp. MPI-PUGE-AT-0042]|nr:hypothetical protein BKA70DRAFT_1476056 [Coprinopsis sp. MPI-PUGE-AT-0042]
MTSYRRNNRTTNETATNSLADIFQQPSDFPQLQIVNAIIPGRSGQPQTSYQRVYTAITIKLWLKLSSTGANLDKIKYPPKVIGVLTTASLLYSTSPHLSSCHAHSLSPFSPSVATVGTHAFLYDTRAIRPLYIDNHPFERYSPLDLLMTFTVDAPALQVFSDNQILRWTSGFAKHCESG